MTVTYVYIAAPYSRGYVIYNIRNAILAADEVVAMQGVPYVPHLTGFYDLVAPHDYQFWMDYDRRWLERCDALWRLEGESPGGDDEVEYAKRRGLPVFGHWEKDKLQAFIQERLWRVKQPW